MLDPIKFHCGDVVVVNGKGEEGTACDLDEAQAVSFALFDCYDGVGDQGLSLRVSAKLGHTGERTYSAIEPPDTVDQSRVRNPSGRVSIWYTSR